MSAKARFIAQRDTFYRDLADAFQASESLFKFLSRAQEFCDTQGRGKLGEIYGDMIARMDGSGDIADIIGPIMPADDRLSLLTVDKAESDVERARVLRGLALTVKRKREMRKVMWKALASPAVAAPVVLALPVMISSQVVPLAEMLPPAEWGMFGQCFYWLCFAITKCYLLIGVLMILAGIWFVRSFPSWTGKLRSRFDSIPPYSIYRDIAASGFLSALAEFMGSRMPLVAALEKLRDQATPWMASRIQTTLDRLNGDEPDDYEEAFRTSLLSPEIHLRLVMAAERGNARTSESNDAFAEGLIQLGTDGMVHVTESVEKHAGLLGVIATVATVLVILVFYGGNALVSNTVGERLQADAEQVRLAK